MTAIYRSTSRTPYVSQHSSLSSLAPVIFKIINGPNTSQHKFHHPPLTDHEYRHGCRLGIDSWADTSCAGRHAHVLEFIEGRSVTAQGFATSLPSIDNLSIANVAYAYDSPSGETYILVINNSIYLGSLMDDSLLNPIQCLLNGIRIDLRPQALTPHCDTAQSVTIPSLDVIFPIEYDGVLPFLSVRRPTRRELDECTHIEITSNDAPWDPHDAVSNIFQVNMTPGVTDFADFCHHEHPIDTRLLHRHLGHAIAATRTLFESSNSSPDYSTISRMSTSTRALITPEDLAKLWRIGIKTAQRTLRATTHQCIRTTGILSRRFRTDHAHMRYRQLSTHHGQFYTDYVKSSVESIRGFIGGNMYVNKLGFKAFFPMMSEKGAESAGTLHSFIQLIGIPKSMHSDNHKNFSQGDFKRQCSRFRIP